MRESRSVVITGASRGLGLASASLLHERGWRVVAAMRSVEAGLERLRLATGAAPDDPRLIGVALDLSDPSSIEGAAKAIQATIGVPDVIVHNAAIAAAGSVEDTPIDVWQQIFTTNLFGPIALTKALLPSMRAAGRGRIVAVASQAGIRGLPGVAAYSASKSAVERWAEALAAEIAPFGLRVTLLVPGTFKTEIITEMTPDYGDHHGPYAEHYAGIHRAGGAMVGKARPPRRFADALAKALDDEAPFTRKALGPDAVALTVMTRVLSSQLVHRLMGRVLGLPRPGALRSSAAGSKANR